MKAIKASTKNPYWCKMARPIPNTKPHSQIDTTLRKESSVPLNTYGLHDLGYKIFLDRYAQNDPNGQQNLQTGDIVVAIVDGDGADTKQRREIGKVTYVSTDQQTARVAIHPSDDEIEIPTTLIDRTLEVTPEQLHKRVAKGIASVEENRHAWEEKFREALGDWKFIPGGRILTAAGTGQDLTAANCFVIPSPHDSRGGIMETLTTMAELMSRGGGVGINISSLRPRNAYVAGVNGRSSGSVSWGALYSYVTGLIEQAGSRRGALMLILNDWHPDIMSFIASKREAGRITNANISVGISDRFMEAVENDEDWHLMFPDTSSPAYNTEWDGSLEKWLNKGHPVKTYETIPARKVWDAIIESAWASAEPGMWFRERSNKLSNSWYYPEGELISTNPCGEQSLPPNGICNLGALNLPKFFDPSTGYVNWQLLDQTTRTAVRFLDDVIDWTPYHIAATEKQQKLERRIGLSVMGLADLMIKCKIRYGSESGAKFIDELFKQIAISAYDESVEIAKEKGPFPRFDAEKFLESGYMRQMPEEIRNRVREHGIRNVTLLTQAPTGTTGTMVNTSTGIEPNFSWKWYRKGRLGYHEENSSIMREWLSENDLTEIPQKLPEYMVTAMDLSPIEHVRVQAAAQRWIDSSISKTVNAPNHYTLKQTSELYKRMYDMGCKGGTIYRDGSRDEQVLNLTNENEDKDKNPPGLPEETSPNTESHINLPAHPETMASVTLRGGTPFGTMFVNISEDPAGVPFAVFITVGKSGSDIHAFAESLGRTISISLQSHPVQYRMSMLQALIDQNRGIGGSRPYGFGPNRTSSFADAVAKLIEEKYIKPKYDSADNVKNLETKTQAHQSVVLEEANLCPSCSNMSLVRIEGCSKCNVCGHSEC